MRVLAVRPDGTQEGHKLNIYLDAKLAPTTKEDTVEELAWKMAWGFVSEVIYGVESVVDGGPRKIRYLDTEHPGTSRKEERDSVYTRVLFDVQCFGKYHGT